VQAAAALRTAASQTPPLQLQLRPMLKFRQGWRQPLLVSMQLRADEQCPVLVEVGESAGVCCLSGVEVEVENILHHPVQHQCGGDVVFGPESAHHYQKTTIAIEYSASPMSTLDVGVDAAAVHHLHGDRYRPLHLLQHCGVGLSPITTTTTTTTTATATAISLRERSSVNCTRRFASISAGASSSSADLWEL